MISFVVWCQFDLASGHRFEFQIYVESNSIKQRTIDNKIKVCDSLISSWVKMRNHVFAENSIAEQKWLEFDKLYGESQVFIGEIFLVSENEHLSKDINEFNERFYRKKWHSMEIDAINGEMEALKVEVLLLVSRMRADIKESTVLNFDDLRHIFKKLVNK